MSSYRPLISKNWRCVLILLIFGGGLPRPVVAAATEAIGAGQILFESAGSSQQGLTALHLKSRADLSINGLVAHVTLEQTFCNDSADWQEGVYVLPMHEQAAVNEMEMLIGERIVRATIKEKAEAKKIYRAAAAAGKKAALVEQNRPNMFRQAVANIAPGETIVVRLSYIQPVTYDRGGFSLRFPMTITPRYIPGVPLGVRDPIHAQSAGLEPEKPGRITLVNAAGWALPTGEVPDAPEITPPMVGLGQGEMINPMELSIALDPGLPLKEVSSDYHDISVKKGATHYEIDLVDGVVPMDRDFVLNWRPVVGSEPKAAVFRESMGGADYVLLMVLPPDETSIGDSSASPMARDVVFVVDTSGSMQGGSIEQAKRSLQRALKGLRPQDRFNVIEFNSQWSRLFRNLQRADAYHLGQAADWVSRLEAGGGTEMHPALQVAINSHDQASRAMSQIVFITDGAVGNEKALFELIHEELGDIRLFPVGIGSAPNSYFMRQAAKFGAGTFTHIGSLQEVGTRMDELFEKIDSPIVTDIRVNWPEGTESYPENLPTLYKGEPLLLTGRASDLGDEIQVSGVTAMMPWQQTVSLEAKASQPGVGTLWARKKIASLEDRRVREGDSDVLKDALLKVALQHKLVSRYTSLVAVEEIVSRMPGELQKTSAVANAVARGQQPQTAMYPNTATTGSLSLLIGGLALLGFVLLRIRRQK